MTNKEAITILVKEVEGIPSDVWDEQSDKFADAVHLAIKVLKERPHGKWINHPIKEFEEWDICTACGTGCRRRIYEDNALTVYNYPFCPNCGADMRGDDHD